MEPLGHPMTQEAVQVWGLLWRWHWQPVRRPVGAAGLVHGHSPWLLESITVHPLQCSPRQS